MTRQSLLTFLSTVSMIVIIAGSHAAEASPGICVQTSYLLLTVNRLDGVDTPVATAQAAATEQDYIDACPADHPVEIRRCIAGWKSNRNYVKRVHIRGNCSVGIVWSEGKDPIVAQLSTDALTSKSIDTSNSVSWSTRSGPDICILGWFRLLCPGLASRFEE